MGKDKRGVERGECTNCECTEYEITEPHHLHCDYCGHPPVLHTAINATKKIRLDHHELDIGKTCEETQIEQNESESFDASTTKPGDGLSCGMKEIEQNESESFDASTTKTGDGLSCGMKEIEQNESESFDASTKKTGDGLSCGMKEIEQNESESFDASTTKTGDGLSCGMKEIEQNESESFDASTTKTGDGLSCGMKEIEQNESESFDASTTKTGDGLSCGMKEIEQNESESFDASTTKTGDGLSCGMKEKEIISLNKELSKITSCAIVIWENGTHKVKCLPCCISIEIGNTNKWSNTKRHLNSAAHHVNVAAELHVHCPREESYFKALEKEFPNTFVRDGISAVCITCKDKISLNTNCYLTNAAKHVHSQKHKQKTTKAVPSKRITHFFRPAPRTSVTSSHPPLDKQL